MKNKIGIVGGGQLGRMLGIAAKQLGFDVIVIDPTPNSPAGQVVDEQIVAGFTDTAAIVDLASRVDYLTFEIELADAEILSKLEATGAKINPAPSTLHMIKDKYAQKQFLTRLGIPVADSYPVKTQADILKVAQKVGYPLLLKQRHDAYDGRGNLLIKSPSQIGAALERFSGQPLYAEAEVKFTKELAVMAARSTTGQVRVYPVVETKHQHHICHVVLAPAAIAPRVQKKAQHLAIEVMQHLKGAGVFGIEMFLTADDQVLVNEIAPRVHNSGHYTLEACVTNQFEQHIRAITGLPLGDTALQVPATVMVNILGDKEGPAQLRGLAHALAISRTSVHIYGKAQTKVDRKMGHLTVTANSLPTAYRKALQARKELSI